MSSARFVEFDKVIVHSRFDRPRLLCDGLYGNDWRTLFTVGVATRTGEAIDNNKMWKLALAKDWRPSLEVSAQDFMFRRSVRFEVPNRRFWLHKRGLLPGFDGRCEYQSKPIRLLSQLPARSG